MSCEFRLIKEKNDTQFNEILSLKSQLSNAFFSNKGEDTSVSGVATSNTESRKPSALLLGTSNLNGIKRDKLSTSVDISKSTAYTLEEAYFTIENYESKPDVVLLHALTNDIKDHSPEQCTEMLVEVVQLISSKWKNTKTIVSLTNNSEMHCVNSEILDGLIKRKFLAQENVIICDNANMWHSNIPQNQLLKDDKFHLSDNGTSMLALI